MKKPTFGTRSQLARYVFEVNRKKSRRPAVATFLPDPPSATPEKDHLSVNSLEVEPLKSIAGYYRAKWQGNNGKVAVCIHKVFDYNEAGKKSGIELSYDRSSAKWQFRSGTTTDDAYRHRPIASSDVPLKSMSHAGVEFARALKDHNAAKFARRLSAKRYHLL